MQKLSNSRLGGTNLKTKTNTTPTLEESPIPVDIEDIKNLQELESIQKIENEELLGKLPIINKK